MMAALVDCRPCYCIVSGSGRGGLISASSFYKEFRAVFRALDPPWYVFPAPIGGRSLPDAANFTMLVHFLQKRKRQTTLQVAS